MRETEWDTHTVPGMSLFFNSINGKRIIWRDHGTNDFDDFNRKSVTYRQNLLYVLKHFLQPQMILDWVISYHSRLSILIHCCLQFYTYLINISEYFLLSMPHVLLSPGTIFLTLLDYHCLRNFSRKKVRRKYEYKNKIRK